MGVEAADLSRWVLCSTEAELGDCLEVPEKTGDFTRTKSGGQGSPGRCAGSSNEISDVQGTSELDGAVGHRVHRVHLASSPGSVGAVVVPLTIEVGTYLSSPFPIVCPIKDGDVGGDGGGCLVVRHYEKIKSSVTGPIYKVGGLRYCRSIVPSTY